MVSNVANAMRAAMTLEGPPPSIPSIPRVVPDEAGSLREHRERTGR